MRKQRRRYTDDDRATTLAVLQSNNGNLSRTSRETGISISTIRDWRDNPHPNLTDLRNQKREDLSSIWEHVARTYLAHALQAEQVASTNSQAAITTAAIATDKLQLLQGQPTEITKNETHRVETPERALRAAATALERRGLVN